MKLRLRKALIGTLILLTTSSGLTQEKPELVGRVIDIDGTRLYTNRSRSNSWFQAYSGMKTYLREKYRTDSKTQAVLEFVAGGRAGIGRNSVVEIISGREIAKAKVGGLRIDSGNFWAKFEKQQEEFQIQTSGGVIGIEGTELLVGVDPERGTTEVLLFEGQISVTDKAGSKRTMFPGDYVVFGGPKGMCVLSYPAPSLRTLVVERFPAFSSFLANQNVTSIPNPASPTLIRGYNKQRDDLLTVLENSIKMASGAKAQGLFANTPSGPPSFNWSPVSGAESYGFYVASDRSFQELEFTSRVEGESFAIPAGAPGMASGEYFWGVVPLGSDGKPMGPVVASSFRTSGWVSSGVDVSQEN